MGESRAGPRILDYLRRREEEMVRLLQRLVEAESPSVAPESQASAQTILRAEFERLGCIVRHVRGKASGGHLLVVPHGRRKGRPLQLMIGHSDTVWPLGTLERMPVRVKDGRLYGPGAYDMKGGLANMVFALKALSALGLEAEVTPLAFINTDEEVGSVDSMALIQRLARAVERVFVLEPALGPAGKLKTARKGNGVFTIRVLGRAAHAGLEPQKGASAILELSLVIQRLFALNDPERGVTVNVGTIDGGLRTNIVAPESQATVDVRVLSLEDARRVEKAVLELQATTPGTELIITGAMNRPPLERTPGNQILWRLAREAGLQLGLDLDEGTSGGGSDGNITSLFTPTLDGLGPVGDGAHAEHEHVVLESMPERATLLALLLLAPPIGRLAEVDADGSGQQADRLLRSANAKP